MMAMAASPTPNTTSIKAHNHPPYKEMITSAIESLKERKGSSKAAIAKYIESNYKDLPPTHDALLSQHLRRLKKQGVLQMVVKSYKISDSGKAPHDPNKNLSSLNPAGVPKKRGRPPKKLTQSSDLNEGIEKKRRGRPRKMHMPAQQEAGPPSEKRKPGRPRKIFLSGVPVSPRNIEPVVKTEKRKPGRPRKGSSPATTMALGVKRKPGRPRKVLSPFKPKLATALALGDKRKRGRPKKLDAFLAVGEKRKRGRPRKLDAFLSLAEKRKRYPPKMLDAFLSSGEKRKRGRPKKLDGFLALGEKRKPGRPKKLAAVLASGEKKKRGRPKKLDSALPSGEKRKRGRPKIKLDARRKPGRPKKSSLSVEPNAATMSMSGETRKRGRPKKISAAMGNGGENVVRMPVAPCTAGELLAAVNRDNREHDNLLAVLLAADTVGGFSSAVENGGGVLPNETQTLPENTVARDVVDGSATAPPLASTVSGEKRKRGRPKKGFTPSSLASVVNGGNGLPDSMPSSTPKGRDQPSKQGNPVSMPEN